MASRSSAASSRSRAAARSVVVRRVSGERVEGHDLDVGCVLATRLLEHGAQAGLGAGVAVLGVHRGVKAGREGGPVAAARRLEPMVGRPYREQRRVAVAMASQDPPEVDTAEREEAQLPCRPPDLDDAFEASRSLRRSGRLARGPDRACRDATPRWRRSRGAPRRRQLGASGWRRRRSALRPVRCSRGGRRGGRAPSRRRVAAGDGRLQRRQRWLRRRRRGGVRRGRRGSRCRRGPTDGFRRAAAGSRRAPTWPGRDRHRSGSARAPGPIG